MSNENGDATKSTEDQIIEGGEKNEDHQEEVSRREAIDVLIQEEDENDNEDIDTSGTEEDTLDEESKLEVINEVHGTNYRTIDEAKKAIQKKNTLSKANKKVVTKKEVVVADNSLLQRRIDELEFKQEHPEVASMGDIMGDLRTLAEANGSDLITTFNNSRLLKTAVAVEQAREQKRKTSNKKIINPSDNIVYNGKAKTSNLRKRFSELKGK